MKTQEMAELMGSSTTDQEADAMIEILKERGIDPDSVHEMPSKEFFALIPQAIERVKEGREGAHRKDPMTLQFSDYKNGGDLFTLRLDDIDSLEPLHESPLQVWVNGSGCDPQNLITNQQHLRRVLRAYERGETCPPYWEQ